MSKGRVFLLMVFVITLGWAQNSMAQASGTRATLKWTAPGDDGMAGRAFLYDVRFSRQPITESNFFSATRAIIFWPLHGGTHERITIGGMTAGESYYFAIKTMDESGNWSAISNVAFRRASQVGVESAATAEFSEPWPNPARSGSVRFRLATPPGDRVVIQAFDVAGRRVREFAPPVARRGEPSELVWDLMDDDGHPLVAGVYLVRAQIGETVTLRRVRIVR
jgi:hypothetical protein